MILQMMHKKNILLIFISTVFFIAPFPFFLVSCNNTSRLETALKFAGDNRSELEKVLKHYKDSTLKYNAACFLIENMPRYFSYTGALLDSVRTAKALGVNEYIDKDIRKKWNNFTYHHLEKVYDAHVITAAYLIDNIDRAFQVWQEQPWGKDLSFDDFCELILPYRIADEPLEDWRGAYYERFHPVLDSLYQGTDVVAAVDTLAKFLRKEYFYTNNDFTLPHLGPQFFLKYRTGSCRESCDYTLYIMRALGIPSTIDSYLYSPERQHPHLWNVLRDTTDLYIPFWFMEHDVNVRRDSNDGRKKGKVYRMCYGWQQGKNPFSKDVTWEYFGHNQIEVDIDSTMSNQHAYLGLFTSQGWLPLDMARLDKNKVTFSDIEPDIIYQPLYRENGYLRPIGYPFSPRDTGIYYFKPDTTRLQKARLWRKFPMGDHIIWFLLQSLNSKFYGSNTPDFKNATLLHEITARPEINYNIITLNHQKPYRYIRFESHGGRTVQLGEISFYSSASGNKKLNVKAIESSPHHLGAEELDMYKAIDGDNLTFFSSTNPGGGGGYIIFDLGEPKVVDRILYIPRNDENFITIGDMYELFYQNGKSGWKSLGKKVADKAELFYDNIPANSLLWLRNLSRGREEQVFWLENGEQKFMAVYNKDMD